LGSGPLGLFDTGFGTWATSQPTPWTFGSCMQDILAYLLLSHWPRLEVPRKFQSSVEISTRDLVTRENHPSHTWVLFFSSLAPDILGVRSPPPGWRGTERGQRVQPNEDRSHRQPFGSFLGLSLSFYVSRFCSPTWRRHKFFLFGKQDAPGVLDARLTSGRRLFLRLQPLSPV
jgi:hypothetical protein